MGLQLPDESERGFASKYPLVWLIAVVVPCAISSYGSYRSAKADADAKASAGYATLVDAQKEMQKAFADHLKADEKSTVQLSTEVSILRQMVFRMWESPQRRAASPVPAPSPASSLQHFAPFKAQPLPATLDAAQKMVDSKK